MDDMDGQLQEDDDQDQNQQYGIDPNQQINPDFLGGQMQPDGYGQEMDDQEDYQGNGMFGGNRDIDDDAQQQEEQQDEYFDDAGDIGYLPADHVSFKFINHSKFYSP